MQTDSARSARALVRPSQQGTAGVPLFHAAWLFALGIGLSRLLWLRPPLVLIALFAIGVVGVLAAMRAPRVAWVPVGALWILAGAWCAEMEPQPAPERTLLKLSDHLLRTVEGTVADAALVRDDVEQNAGEPPSQRIDVRLSSIEFVDDAEDAQKGIGGAVRLTVQWPGVPAGSVIPFRCGERVRAVVRVLPPEVYHDAGAWNRADYLLEQGITATASVDAVSVERIGHAPFSMHCALRDLQRAVSARIMGLPAMMRRFPAPIRLDREDAVMLTAMVTGDRTFLSKPLRMGFERTGSFHMLVVSGLHLAIVAGCILWLTQRAHLPRVPETLLTLAASFGYALFTGFATPVQRSLWMVTLYLLGRMFYRERAPLNVLGFAALCLLSASPRSLFDASFQMTLLAVVSIAGIATPLLETTVQPYIGTTRGLRQTALDVKLEPRLAQFRVMLRMFAARLERTFHARVGWGLFPWTVRLCLRTVEVLTVTLVVELAMTLPMAVYFHRITLLALPVNLMILPLVGLLMPMALLAVLAAAIWMPLAALPAMAAALVLHCSAGLIQLFGSIRWGDLRIPGPAAWQWLAFIVLMAATMLLARSGRIWMRRGAWVTLLCAAVAATVPRVAEHPHDALLLEAIDVGQGDSLLLITPDGKTLLVDGGGFDGGRQRTRPEFDIGEEVVSAALWSRGIRHLDVVALSHAHSDHMGGLPAVLRNFHPKELWVGRNPRVAAYDSLLEEAGSLGIRVRTLHAGDAMAFGDARARVLAPLPDYRPGKEPANNDSLVLRVEYGATAVLLEGDAEAEVERSMLAEPGIGSSVLKVGHHGSESSTGPAFLARVAPRWAVVSCGLHNRYGHPQPEVLRELQDAKIRTLSTDINGAACLRLDGTTVEQEVGCAEGNTF